MGLIYKVTIWYQVYSSALGFQFLTVQVQRNHSAVFSLSES